MRIAAVPSHDPSEESVLRTHLHHPSFEEPRAHSRYDPRIVLENSDHYPLGYMPDETTRDFGQRMHYCLYRAGKARTLRERAEWRRWFYALRDRIVLGNQKLVYKAVRYRKAWQVRADDLIGEGHLVLINAVERYNPWLGVRFSTYAFTCLVRALVRLTRKRIGHEQRFQTQANFAPEVQPPLEIRHESDASIRIDLDHFFQDKHPLLSQREKLVLRLRFGLGEQDEAMKLELIGERLGLSKERIRQVQVSALTKLRDAVALREGVGAEAVLV